MDEIPTWMWIGSGIIITGFSLFLGFIRPVPYNAFFKLMFVIGIGMLVYTYIFKIKIKSRTLQDDMEQRRMQRMRQGIGEYEVEIDIDDFRKNPQKRQKVLQRGYPFRYSNTAEQFRMQMERQENTNQFQNRQQNINYSFQNSGYQKQIPQNNRYKITQNNRQKITQNPNFSSYNVPISGYCSHCGTPLLKEHKFCPICGARVK